MTSYFLIFNIGRIPRCRGRGYYPHAHKCCFRKQLRPRNQPCIRHVPRYRRVGCFRDKRHRALGKQLGTFPRRWAVRKCASLAWKRGFKAFSVQYGGQCFSGKVAHRTYYKYGGARNCRHGVGGTWANDVYFFSSKNLRRSRP